MSNDAVKQRDGVWCLYLIDQMGRPSYISKENWDKMSWKEKDYIRLIQQGKRTKKQIKRILYITTDVWLWKLRKKVLKYITLVNWNTEKDI